MKIKNRTVNFMIFCIYTITLFLGNEIFLGFFDVSGIINYIVVLLPTIFIGLIFIDNKTNIKLNVFNKSVISLALLFISWSIISFFTGIHIGGAGVRCLIHFSIIILLAIFISKIKFEQYQVKKIKRHIFIAFFITLIYGIIEYLFGFNLDMASNDKYPNMKGRVYSTLFIATLFDKYICIMTLFLIREMCDKKNHNNLFYKILFVLSGICVALTFSRTGLLLYFGIIFLFIIHEIFRKKIYNIILVIITTIILFFIPGVKYSFQSGINQLYSIMNIEPSNQIKITSIKIEQENDAEGTKDNDKNPYENDKLSVENDSSKKYRDYYKNIGKAFIKEYPINGIGIGNYSYLYNNQNAKKYLADSKIINGHYMYPHSSYIQLGAETGFVGVVLFYLFLYLIIFNLNVKDNKKHFIFMNLVFVVTLAISYVEGIIYAKQFFYIFIMIYAFYCNNSVVGLKTHFESKKGRKQIDILALHLGTGGIESSIKNTAEILARKHNVNVVSFYNLENNISNQFNKKIKIIYLCDLTPNKEELKKAFKGKHFFTLFKEAFKAVKILYLKKKLLMNYIRKTKADIIISTRMEFSTILNDFGSDQVVKIVQEHRYHNNNRRYINKIKYNYTNIDYLCALTNKLKSDYERFLSNNSYTKVVCVPNMIDVKSFNISKLEGNTIISVGRLVPVKRINEAIDIVSNLNCKYNFKIVGDGIEKNKLNEQIKSLNQKKTIKLLGNKNQSQVKELLSNSDVFIMTSVSEGLPMVLLEAMCSGVPCIAYDFNNGLEDIIDDGKTGYIIYNRNENEFIEKLTNILENNELRKMMGKNSVIKAEKYSQKNISKIWYDLIK